MKLAHRRAAGLAAIALALAIAGVAALWPGPTRLEPASGAVAAPDRESERIAVPPPSEPGVASTEATTTQRTSAWDRVLTVSVEGRSGCPLPGARLELQAADGSLLLGTTDDSGRYLGPVSKGAQGNVVASRPGYEPSTQELPAGAEISLRFVLQAREAIEGRVVYSTGESVGAGFGVVESTGDATANTDDKGRFVIVPSRPSLVRDVNLEAGGLGCMTSGPQYGVRLGAVDVELVVDRLYGVLLTFVDASGGPLLVSAALATSDLRRATTADAYAQVVTPSPAAFLAGLDPALARLDPAQRLFLFVHSSPEAFVVGPNHSIVRYPGYAETRVEFEAGPILPSVPRFDVALVRTAAGFGSLELVLEGCDGVVGNGRLQLESDGVFVGFTCRTSGRTRIEGIPFGAWKARYSGAGTVFPDKPLQGAELLIGAEPARWVVPCIVPGSLEIEVVDAAGTHFTGWIRGMVGESMVWKAGSISAKSASSFGGYGSPYSVTNLAPGELSVQVAMPDVVDGLRKVEIRAGEIARARFTLQ